MYVLDTKTKKIKNSRKSKKIKRMKWTLVKRQQQHPLEKLLTTTTMRTTETESKLQE